MSEIVVVLMMIGVMVITVNLRACFFEALLPSRHPDMPPDPKISEDSCRYFLLGFGATRLVLTAYTLYVAVHVTNARPRACRELLLLSCAAAYALAFVHSTGGWPVVSGGHVSSLLFSAFLLDVCAFTIDDFLPAPLLVADQTASRSAEGGASTMLGAAIADATSTQAPGAAAPANAPPVLKLQSETFTRRSVRRCAALGSRLRLLVPQDTAYLVRRHERMLIISSALWWPMPSERP